MPSGDDMFTVVIVGLSALIFCIVLLGLGSWYGGSWEIVAQGVVSFVGIVVGIFVAGMVLMRLVK